MGLVIGISVCVGGIYAAKKTHKRRKKKKNAKKLAEQELEGANDMGPSTDEAEDSGCGFEEATESATVDVHAEVISERGYSGSVRKRNQARPDDSGYTFAKVKSDKPSHGMSKLEEEPDDHIREQVNSTSRGQRDSAGSPKGHKSHKSYKHLDLNESNSEDEYEDNGPDGVPTSTNYGKSSIGNWSSMEPGRKLEDNGYHSEENYHIAKDMRMSIRVGESGNTIFKIYSTDNSKKKPSAELRSTTAEVPV